VSKSKPQVGTARRAVPNLRREAPFPKSRGARQGRGAQASFACGMQSIFQQARLCAAKSEATSSMNFPHQCQSRPVPPARRAYGSERRPCPSLKQGRLRRENASPSSMPPSNSTHIPHFELKPR
jgi:hypothetical protein